MKPRGRALLYPERKRCFACRSYFCFLVLDLLYCSYGCAGHSEPSQDPADWPREHYSMKWKSSERVAKRDWTYQHVAERAARKREKQAYQCTYCLGWHIGSPDPAKTYPGPRLISR